MKNIVDLSREEAIDILLRMTQDSVYDTGNIIVLDDVISQNDCDWILNELQTNNIEDDRILKNLEFGYDVRGGKSYATNRIKSVDDFIYQNVATKIYEALTKNQHYRQNIRSHEVFDLGYEYCVYKENEFLKLHHDGKILNYGNDRNFLNLETDVPYLPFIVASSTLMLNTIDEGAELVFPNQHTTIKQKAGRVVIWGPDPQFQHHTNPVPSGSLRHVVVAWYALKNIVAVEPDDIVNC